MGSDGVSDCSASGGEPALQRLVTGEWGAEAPVSTAAGLSWHDMERHGSWQFALFVIATAYINFSDKL